MTNKELILAQLMRAMIKYDGGDAPLIQHFVILAVLALHHVNDSFHFSGSYFHQYHHAYAGIGITAGAVIRADGCAKRTSGSGKEACSAGSRNPGSDSVKSGT